MTGPVPGGATPGSAAPGIEPLAGYTIGITAARRREEFGVALQRRGARVMYGPAIRIIMRFCETFIGVVPSTGIVMPSVSCNIVHIQDISCTIVNRDAEQPA